MSESDPTKNDATQTPQTFKAETRQLLDILIHSLYTEREIFLRELISNAADALTRFEFEQLTNRDVLNPDLAPSIRITTDPAAKTLTISDTGLGMTATELTTNLGTIARSGAREFLAAAQADGQKVTDLIGQFGVGFYSAFMVADQIEVVSRSYLPAAEAARWVSDGAETFTVGPAEKETRGSAVILHLRPDAEEFLQEHRLREIIRKHSDFIPYPIFLGDDQEQVNRATALWRQTPREVDPAAYADFYKQLTLDFEPPLTHTHLVIDAPVQMYAVLFVPASSERTMFSLRRQEGLKLYARKVLIQEYNQDLLPEYLNFIQGVVDSEDLPLNVSRETVQSSRVMAQLKKLVTAKVLEMLKKLAADDSAAYGRFWNAFGRALKQGVATEPTEPESLYPLLRFPSLNAPEALVSLDDYVAALPADQTDIYYLLADDERAALQSPHLEAVRRLGRDVLLLTDPLDPFLLTRLRTYQDHPLLNVAQADLPLPAEAEPAEPPLSDDTLVDLVERFKQQLGERVSAVRISDRLTASPARLLDPSDAPNPEMQRVYRLLNKDFTAPTKVLEINPRHPIMAALSRQGREDPLNALVIEQIYENALLLEGLHPNPTDMVARIQQLIEAALV